MMQRYKTNRENVPSKHHIRLTEPCSKHGRIKLRQFIFLMSNLSVLSDKSINHSTDDEKPRHLVYGIKGIADTFGCSIPTANRIKRSGIIDGAITQVGRKIIIDADLALELAANAKKQGKEVWA